MANGTNIGKAYVQIVPTTQGIQSQLSEELGDAGYKSADSFSSSFGSRTLKGLAALGIGKIIVSGIKASLSEGAALEQSIGGIETMFKDNADTMLSYANEAYKTAGISANDYMEQATSFSASLLQSLDGDTAKAAESANQALIDMSDNANKFGTDIQSIQNAYQGFAKQNYTMLDNLKLGYGGTKSEMERLLADAQKLTGVEYNIDNLSDVYEAIHVIQEEIGVTGTTAEEAASTFSGSLGMMRSAWTNLLGHLAIGESVTSDLTALGESILTFGSNLIRMVGNIGIGIVEAIPQLLDSFINGIRENSGTVLATGMELLGNLVQGIMNAIPNMVAYIPTVVTTMAGILRDNFPQMVEKGVEILGHFVEGIQNALPALVAAVPQIISAIWDTISGVDWISLGIKVLKAIISGAMSLLASVATLAHDIVTSLWNNIKNTNWLELGKNVLRGIINGIRSMLGALWDVGKEIASGLMTSVKNLLGIHSPSKEFEWIGQMVGEGFAFGIGESSDIVNDAMNDITNAATGNVVADIGVSGNYAKGGYELATQEMPLGATINVYPSAGMDEQALADKVGRILNRQVNQRKAVMV